MDLNEERKSNQDFELARSKLFSKFLNQQRKNFDYADVSMWLLQDKNETDIIFLGERLDEWKSKAKPESNQLQVLTDMMMALFRIQAYSFNLETINKQSVAELIKERERCKSAESETHRQKLKHLKEISSLKLELENAKKQIEFHEKSQRK